MFVRIPSGIHTSAKDITTIEENTQANRSDRTPLELKCAVLCESRQSTETLRIGTYIGVRVQATPGDKPIILSDSPVQEGRIYNTIECQITNHRRKRTTLLRSQSFAAASLSPDGFSCTLNCTRPCPSRHRCTLRIDHRPILTLATTSVQHTRALLPLGVVDPLRRQPLSHRTCTLCYP